MTFHVLTEALMRFKVAFEVNEEFYPMTFTPTGKKIVWALGGAFTFDATGNLVGITRVKP